LNPVEGTPIVQPESATEGSAEKLSERDLKTFLWAIRLIRGFFQTKKLSHLVKDEILPGQNQSEIDLASWVLIC
jgi:hypothetical protein